MIMPMFLMILEPNIKPGFTETEKKNSDPDQANLEVRATADTT
jgi:hypothetical protein